MHCLMKWLHLFEEWSTKLDTLYLDVPFNRFVIFTLTYAAFVVMVIVTFCGQIFGGPSNYQNNTSTLMHWSTTQIFIPAQVLTMFLNDMYMAVIMKSNSFS